ncbi:LiaI-LiaF-like domain-containing protein, partial [Xanthomonas campestris]
MRYRLIPALFLITLGSLFLLDNLGLARFDLGNLVSTWWP